MNLRPSNNPSDPDYFTLPDLDEPGAGNQSRPDPRRINSVGKSQRVLVVDDERSIADSLAEILCRFGYEATACYDGFTAVELAREQCPDVVVTDVMMPRMNGVETALTIRELCPQTRVLLFSGQAGTTDILKNAETRGHEFELLPKPIHPRELIRKLG